MDFRPELRELRHFRNQKFAGGKIRGGEPVSAFVQIERGKVIVHLMLQHLRIGDGAGGDDADDIAPDEAVLIARLPRVFCLLQNGNFVPSFHEFIEVRVKRVVRDAGHRRRRTPLILVATGSQGDFQKARD